MITKRRKDLPLSFFFLLLRKKDKKMEFGELKSKIIFPLAALVEAVIDWIGDVRSGVRTGPKCFHFLGHCGQVLGRVTRSVPGISEPVT